MLTRNIWSLFRAILGFGLILVVVLLFIRWQSICAQYESFHVNRIELSSQALSTILSSHELMLEVIGQELFSKYKDVESQKDLQKHAESMQLLDRVLQLNPSLAGIGLVQADGVPLITAPNPENINKINISDNPLTKFSFEHALDSNGMVLGRTYYSPVIEEWVIPLRKRIRDQDDNVVAVMTAGLKLDRAGLFDESTSYSEHDSFLVYREIDRYIQFLAKSGAKIDNYTATPIDKAQSLRDQNELASKLGISIDKIKTSQQAFIVKTNRLGESYITAFAFNSRYQLWIVSEVSYTPIMQAFLVSLLTYSLIYIGIIGILYKWFDVIENAESKRLADLFFLSRHDDLTGLENKTALVEAFIPLVASGQIFTIGVVNIDNFRKINDQYGLDSADSCLSLFAEKMRSFLTEKVRIFRLNADEFVFLQAKTDIQRAHSVAEILSRDLAYDVQVGNFDIQLSATIGLVQFPNHGSSLDELTQKARLAIYNARDNGLPFAQFAPAMEEPFARRVKIEEKLKKALNTEQGLYVHYQLLFDNSYQPSGVEALARWDDEELGRILPLEFIDIAEKSGLMARLGAHIMELSIKEFTQSILDNNNPISLSINISVIQFKQKNFVEQTFQIIERYGLRPELLNLEITESLFMDDVGTVITVIGSLRARGIKVSLDDFGTGYSSLSMLRKLPIDELKIDKNFSDELLHDVKAQSLMKSIVSFAHSCDLASVAEGIECEAQANMLQAMGCDKLQGFHFAKPMSSVDVKKRLLHCDTVRLN